MPARPNFTDVKLNGNRIQAFGESVEDDLDDLVGIQVFVSQEAQAAGGAVRMAAGVVPVQDSPWTAEFDSNGLVAGPAVAIGVETHSQPFTSITWAQPVEITE
jgi:hypothetical protein